MKTKKYKNIKGTRKKVKSNKKVKKGKHKKSQIAVKITPKLVLNPKNKQKIKKILVHKRIFILNTGGTIGMVENKQLKALLPKRGYLRETLKKMKIPSNMNVSYLLYSMKPLLDSSNMREHNWLAILEVLNKNYDKFDGFIVIHGTDTMAYTASILSFFLMQWQKPVILTGSQLPFSEYRNDARNNMVNAIVTALYPIPEVLIVFGNKILRGNCTSKKNSVSFEAYDSPNVPRLGDFGVQMQIRDHARLTEIEMDDVLQKTVSKWDNKADWNRNNFNIATITILPHDNSKILDFILMSKPAAVIMKTYGVGNVPIVEKQFLHFLTEAQKNNIHIINISQCFEGGVFMDYYETGKELEKYGVLSAKTMTFEAVYAKLFFLYKLFGINNPKLIKKYFYMNLAGELTTTTDHKKILKLLTPEFKHYQEI